MPLPPWLDGPVLVTGGAGFVGANLVRRLVASSVEVHLLLNSTIDTWRVAELAGWTRQDVPLHDQMAVDDLFDRVRPRVVFHLAAHGAYSWQSDEELMIQTNILGTKNLLRAASRSGVAAFVSSGSSSEYGFSDRATHETDRVEPNSAYALTKAAAAMYCRLVASETGLWAPTLRLYSVYGPFEDPGRLFPALVGAALSGRLPVLADPRTARDFVYVEDVVDALLKAAARGPVLKAATGDAGRIFNVASGRMTSLEALVDLVSEVFNLTESPQWGSMDDRAWDARIWVGDPSRSLAELGWKPRVGLREGLRLMSDWMSSPAAGTLYARCGHSRQVGSGPTQHG